jgi:Ca2+-binding RTX toxin-like protein
LVGTPGPDVIVGLDGNDDIAAQRGDDLVCAGAGNDRIGDQPDRVFDGDLFQGSGDDDDHVFLQSANNVVAYGNRADDTLEFPSGDGAGPSNLVLDGGAGSDRLVSFFGLESVPGRPGSGRADRRGRLQRPRWVGARHASRR